MDPISQGILGASAPQCIASKKDLGTAAVLGLISGMAPDLDILIQSSRDPLLFLEYHRQFTHSLIFIPLGGLLCALVLYPLFARKRHFSFLKTWTFCTLGFATHALLDACTTYGTLLLWPFSNTRIAWNNLSIIDPFFTLPVITLVLLSVYRKTPLFARIALCWAIIYPCLGVIQRERAEQTGDRLAADRGHDPIGLSAKPSFGNMILWKIVYEYDGQYFVDAVRVGLEAKSFPGESITKLDIARDLPWLNTASQQARDIERFRWFSMGYLAVHQHSPNLIVDIRYSFLPNKIDALWGIELNPEAGDTEHVGYFTRRDGAATRIKVLMEMLFN